MSIKLINYDKFYGYRVRRAINHRLYQEYFSLTDNGKRLSTNGKHGKIIKEEALERDRVLALEQQKDKLRRKSELCFSKDGTVRGINFLEKKEKSGTVTPIFQMGIHSEIQGRVVSTSVSLNAHGKRGAWLKIIDLYCEHKKINKRSALYGKLMAAMPDIPA